MKIKSTSKLHIDKKKGSATIYIKKDVVEKLNFVEKTELYTEYDTETNELTIREL